jgi:hypothetical protein
MFKIFFIFISLSSPNLQSPADLSWGEKADRAPIIENFTHWYGSVNSSIIYANRKNIDGIETELQLYYSNRALTSATLFLGPTGIGPSNCTDIYSNIISALNEKYGKLIYKKEIIDPVGNDLVFNSTCRKVLVGVNQYAAYWTYKNIKIEAWLYGDGEDIIIAIDYIFKKDKELKNLKNIF